jgi:fumarate reductase subunit C
MLWHVVTWFQILPKTMPKLILHGRPVEQRTITAVALVVGAFGSVLLLLVAVIAGAWS